MYLRHKSRPKDGKDHVYWQLVRSVRRNGKVRQETVAQLGELDAAGRAKAQALARRISGRGDQRDLFEEAPPVATSVEVRLDQIRVERDRSFGAVWWGWVLWQALGLDRVCRELLPRGRQGAQWAHLAAVLVIARLCEPSSELHIAEDWFRRTALEDILGIPAATLYDEQLYRALDKLLPHKEALEQQLQHRLGELFAVEYDLLLYDLTSTYFAGEANYNPLAQRGYSRDHRPDCKQVNIAVIVTREGIPLGHEVFAGNVSDVKTLKQIVESVERRYGKARRIWVMDRGLSSQKNVAWLEQEGRLYVVATPRSEWKRWRAQLEDQSGWQMLRDDVEGKLCVAEEGKLSFVLCRSAQRRLKEKAMHQRFAARIDTALTKLERRLQRSKKPLARAPIDRQLGRLLQRNSRAAARYQIELIDDATVPATVCLQWSIRADWERAAEISEGCYVLRTNVADFTAQQTWQTYVQLTQAEAAFRIHKSELSIRPVWHWKERRVRSHILVCFLAYVLWKTLEQWQSKAGLGNSPRTLLEEFERLRSTDVVLPLTQDPAGELRLRCVVRPDKAQAILLQRMGLRLPERIRITEDDLRRAGKM
ncbi:MAG: IS1634 family transposase [Sulfuricaulis sp.]|uniref:IS1634 family transposase n=1 Tax=Sulfuricaulis sp. TaxID=2003553 RepID=UPI003C4F6543